MLSFVVPLAEAEDVNLAGGKAAALARLINADFPVPPGFVITTSVKDVDKVADEILKFFDELDAEYVAVRSSAAAEDGAKDAWAGQLDTFLNVTRGDLIQKIKLCQQSTKSERALAYAKQKGLKSGGTAVIVQAMIQSEVSGIAFSANPVTGNKGQVVIEAGFGLNEPIVSGEITPDTYTVSKTDLKILQKHIAAQEKQFVLGENGQNEYRTVDNGDDQKLSDSRILEVAQIAVKLEEYSGFSVDCEWTYADSKLYLLQSRPITTLT